MTFIFQSLSFFSFLAHNARKTVHKNTSIHKPIKCMKHSIHISRTENVSPPS